MHLKVPELAIFFTALLGQTTRAQPANAFAMGTIPASLTSVLSGYPVASAKASAGADGAIIEGTANLGPLGTATIGASAGPNGADITAVANLGGQLETFAASFGWGGWGGTATAMQTGGTTPGAVLADRLPNQAAGGLYAGRVAVGIAAGFAVGAGLIIL